MAVYEHDRFTKEEFAKFRTGILNIPAHNRTKRAAPQSDISTCSFNYPSSLNWFETNNVAPVQDQGVCGSCWIFSGVAAIESAFSIKYKRPVVKLSESNILDCIYDYSGYRNWTPCNGGLAHWVWNMTAENPKGMVANYNYAAYNQSPQNKPPGTCVSALREPNTEVDRWINFANVDPEVLKCNLAKYGPMTVTIGTYGGFGSYKSGIFDDVACGNWGHSVLLVGYGSELNSAGVMTPYWLLKNQWGSGWGQSGFIKVAINSNNICGVTLDAQFPVLIDGSSTKVAAATSSCLSTNDFYNGNVYLKSSCVYWGSKNYVDADAYCKSIGMKLFTVDPVIQNAFLKYMNNMNGVYSMWINGGSTCLAVSGSNGAVTIASSNCMNTSPQICEFVGRGKLKFFFGPSCEKTVLFMINKMGLIYTRLITGSCQH